jgi:hypothetical protein
LVSQGGFGRDCDRTLEDTQDPAAFEEAITADFDAQLAVDREFVLRLADLPWKLRRTTRIEAGLFNMQATLLGNLNAHQADQRQTEALMPKSLV